MLHHPKQKSRFAIASSLACAAFLIAVGFTAAQESQRETFSGKTATSSSTQTALNPPVGSQETPPVHQSNKKSNSFANADSVQFRVTVFEGKPDAIHQVLLDCAVESTTENAADWTMASVPMEQVRMIRKQLDDYQQLFGTLVSGRNNQKLRAESIREIEMGSSIDSQTKPVGLRLEITPKIQDGELTVECRIEESAVAHALSKNESATGNGKPGFSVKRLNSGVKLKQIGDAVLFTQTMVKEQSTNKDDVFTSVYLVEPIRAFRADHAVSQAAPENERQTEPAKQAFKLSAGDSLQIYLANALKLLRRNGQGIGVPLKAFKVSIGGHGKVVLPDVGEVHVEGLTISAAKDAIGQAYQDKGILNPDQASKVLITVHKSNQSQQTKNASGLRLTLPELYKTDSGDVLGLYVEGVLGGNRPTVQLPELGQGPPSIGSPVPVRADGTISLPLIKPLAVRGLTVQQIEALVQRAYCEGTEPILKRDARLVVTLIRARTVRIFVVRADGLNQKKRGFVLNLPAYKNDVFNALMQTGGLPGIDANKELQIARGTGIHLNTQSAQLSQSQSATELPVETISAAPEKTDKIDLNGGNGFRRDQIELHQNDVVYVYAKRKSGTDEISRVQFNQPLSEHETVAAPIASIVNEKIFPKATQTKDFVEGKLIAYQVEYFEADILRMKAKFKSLADIQSLQFKSGVHVVSDKQTPKNGKIKKTGLRQTLDHLDFQLIDQPVLVASTSRPAEFLSGGELLRESVVPNKDGSFEKCRTSVGFGLRLKLTPTIKGGKLISNVEVSNSWLNSNQTIRTIEHGIELQTPQLYSWEIHAATRTLPGESFVVIPDQISANSESSNPNGKIGILIVSPKRIKVVEH